jgi:4-hydroxy-2-oxoheptanedioate aldolase
MSPIKQRVTAGQSVLGTWAIVACPTNAEIAALAGLDFQIFDLEHGAYDLPTLGNVIRSCEGAGCAPLVRVADLSPAAFQAALDLGAHGLIVPRITSAKDAHLAVQYSKYPPLGVRGYNPFTRAANYAAPESNQHGKLNNDYTMVGVIIENKQAYAELPDILGIPGIDIVYLGVYDMSLALGCEGHTQHKAVSDFVIDASSQICAAGKTVGLMVRTQTEIRAAISLGARFLVYSVDSFVLYKAFSGMVAEFTSARQRG